MTHCLSGVSARPASGQGKQSTVAVTTLTSSLRARKTKRACSRRDPMMAPCYGSADCHTLICALALLSSPSVVCRVQSASRGMRDFSLSIHRRRCARLPRGETQTTTHRLRFSIIIIFFFKTFSCSTNHVPSALIVATKFNQTRHVGTQSAHSYTVSFPFYDEKCHMQGVQES